MNTNIEEPADVGVSNALGQAHLTHEATDVFRIGGDVGPKGLDGDRFAENRVVGAIDLTHPSAANQTFDSILARQQIARQEGLVDMAEVPFQEAPCAIGCVTQSFDIGDKRRIVGALAGEECGSFGRRELAGALE
jgi:hypothetical protein